jgi:hemerythrin
MIEWRDKLRIDDGVIDEDHKNLIDVVNRFEHARAEYRELLPIVQRLKHYARTHFEREEELQRRIGFTETEAHKGLHEELAQHLDLIIQEFVDVESGDYRAIQVELAVILQHWLVDHILGEDMKMKPYLPAATARTFAH